ncbi:MAG TPA: aldo/keto reductase [Thermoleophilaceae bacterium]|nr:aldo/keto reductase [Thermoleophilaceae bacterium]
MPGDPSNGPPAAAAGELTLGEDLTVRRMGYGAMRLTGDGVWGDPPDIEAAKGVLRRAVELGVNLIDTADSYGPEVSERLIGEARAPYPDDLVVATKGGLTRGGPSDWRADCRPEHLKEACEGSLRRLRTDRIDVYQLHTVDPEVPLAESVGAIAELQAEGKVRHVGLSNVSADQLEEARGIVPIVSVQNRYSLSDRGQEDALEACEREGIPFLPWFPLASGGAARGGGELDRVAREHGATAVQVALAWLLARSPVMLPIPGTSSAEHLEENVAAAAIQLSEEDLEALGA